MKFPKRNRVRLAVHFLRLQSKYALAVFNVCAEIPGAMDDVFELEFNFEAAFSSRNSKPYALLIC